MTSQLALDLDRPAGQGPIVSPLHVAAMIESLSGRDWQTARELGAGTENARRVLRAIAEHSAGQILSGQRGYKLTLEATPQDVEHAKWLKSQGDKMRGRWLQIQRVWHRGARSAESQI